MKIIERHNGESDASALMMLVGLQVIVLASTYKSKPIRVGDDSPSNGAFKQLQKEQDVPARSSSWYKINRTRWPEIDIISHYHKE